MTRLLVSMVVVLWTGSLLAAVPYQLKYKSIPPKPKVVELIRESGEHGEAPRKSAVPQRPVTEGQRNAMAANTAWRAERWQSIAEMQNAKAQYRTQQVAAARAVYYANLEQRVRLADIYNESQAAAAGVLPVAWELERRSLNHDAYLRRYEQPVVILESGE